jgi:transcription antitermination factor NusG
MIINEVLGKKVVVHIENGTQVVLHRGVLEQADAQFIRLKKDTETLYFSMNFVVAIHPV